MGSSTNVGLIRGAVMAVGLGLVVGAGLVTSAGATAGSLPDLAISTTGPAVVYVGGAFSETYTVTDEGGAPANDPSLSVTTPEFAASTASMSMACVDTERGHSGRGGGYTHTGYACTTPSGSELPAGGTLTVVADFDPTTTPTIPQELAATTSAEQHEVAHTLSQSITPVVPPVPSAPTGVTVSQDKGSLVVGCTPGSTDASGVTVTSTASAVPDGGGPTLSGAVATGAGGPAVIDLGGVEATTTYAMTVSSADAAGSTAAAPVDLTTEVSVVRPGAPAITGAAWNATFTSIGVDWDPAPFGDSTTTAYRVRAVPQDGGARTVLVRVGDVLTANVATADDNVDWVIRVRACDGAGWGRWSAPRLVSGS